MRGAESEMKATAKLTSVLCSVFHTQIRGAGLSVCSPRAKNCTQPSPLLWGVPPQPGTPTPLQVTAPPAQCT